MSIGDEIWERVQSQDAPGMVALLDDLGEEGLAEARAWYRRERKAVDERLNDYHREAPHARFAARYELRALLLVWLGSPAMAGRNTEWGWFQPADTGPSARQGIWSHDRAWIETFYTALVASNHGTYDVIRSICDAYQLPHPTTPYVVSRWLSSVAPRPRLVDGSWVPSEDAASLMREDSRLPELWHLVLENPDLGSNAWTADALCTLVTEGVLDRDDLVRAVVDQLTSPTRPQGQRVLTTLLADVGLTAQEVPGGLPMLQGLLATCHGRATLPLLPLAIELLDRPDDLLELAGTVTGRTEKKQRQVLLDLVLDPTTAERFGPTVTREVLALYAALDDAALADRARAALGADETESEQPESLGLWELGFEPPEPPTYYGDIRALGNSPVEAVHSATRLSGGDVGELWRIPAALSILNRGVHREGADVVKKVLGEVPLDPHLPGSFGQLVRAWVDGESLTVARPDYYRAAMRDPARSLTVGHLIETMRRLGRSPELLSTPSFADGTLSFDDLARRLRACETFGPLDLLLALLRMRPVDAARADELAGLSPVPPDESLPPTVVRDAVVHVREAVSHDGLRPPRLALADLDAHGWLTDEVMPPDEFWAACLPVDLSPFEVEVADLVPPYPWHGRMSSYAVAPGFPDLRIRENSWAENWLQHRGWWQVWVPESGYLQGTPGVLMHATFLREYAQSSKHPRAMALEATTRTIAAGTFHADTALVAAEVLLRLGKLNLARCAQAWEELFLVGGLRTLWPVALGTAAAACRQTRKPPGLPDLLRMLARYAGEVPDVSLPEEIACLAAEKGTTKSHAEARRLLQAVGS